jgi:hypothetical protein
MGSKVRENPPHPPPMNITKKTDKEQTPAQANGVDQGRDVAVAAA